MINVQEYALEALVQRGWHLAEFPFTLVMKAKESDLYNNWNKPAHSFTARFRSLGGRGGIQ